MFLNLKVITFVVHSPGSMRRIRRVATGPTLEVAGSGQQTPVRLCNQHQHYARTHTHNLGLLFLWKPIVEYY